MGIIKADIGLKWGLICICLQPPLYNVGKTLIPTHQFPEFLEIRLSSCWETLAFWRQLQLSLLVGQKLLRISFSLLFVACGTIYLSESGSRPPCQFLVESHFLSLLCEFNSDLLLFIVLLAISQCIRQKKLFKLSWRGSPREATGLIWYDCIFYLVFILIANETTELRSEVDSAAEL